MSRCPPHYCSRCCNEICLEKITQKADARRKEACSIGPILEISHDSKDDSITDTVNPEDEPICVEEALLEGDYFVACRIV